MPSSAPPRCPFLQRDLTPHAPRSLTGAGTLRLRPGTGSGKLPWRPTCPRAPQFPRGPGADLAPEAEGLRGLTFDPVAAVQGDLAVDLGLVWLDNDEEPPRHRAVQLPLGPRVLDGGERVPVAAGRVSGPAGRGDRGVTPERDRGGPKADLRPVRPRLRRVEGSRAGAPESGWGRRGDRTLAPGARVRGTGRPGDLVLGVSPRRGGTRVPVGGRWTQDTRPIHTADGDSASVKGKGLLTPLQRGWASGTPC